VDCSTRRKKRLEHGNAFEEHLRFDTTTKRNSDVVSSQKQLTKRSEEDKEARKHNKSGHCRCTKQKGSSKGEGRECFANKGMQKKKSKAMIPTEQERNSHRINVKRTQFQELVAVCCSNDVPQKENRDV